EGTGKDGPHPRLLSQSPRGYPGEGFPLVQSEPASNCTLPRPPHPPRSKWAGCPLGRGPGGEGLPSHDTFLLQALDLGVGVAQEIAQNGGAVLAEEGAAAVGGVLEVAADLDGGGSLLERAEVGVVDFENH